jgi:peptide/nickel transport system substrate-binding protein
VGNTTLQNNKQKKELRDYFWNYPDFLIKIFFYSRPLGYIISFSILAFYIGIQVISPNFIKTYFVEKKTVLVEGTIGKVGNLVPIFLTQNQVDKDLRRLLFQKLIEIDASGAPQPEIAEKWDLSENKKEYTFYIKHNLKFSDGYELNAKDVKYTYDTAIYLADVRELDTVGKAISGVSIELVDDYTVKFVLKEENATFFEAVATYIIPQHYYGEVSPDQLQDSYITKLPIGSGPYFLEKQADSYLTLSRSITYTPYPNIEKIEYRMYPDYSSLKIAYQNNTLDTVSNIGAYDKDFTTHSSNFRDLTKSLEIRNKLVYINNRNDLLSNASIRKGFAYITDRNRLVNNASVSGQVILGPYNADSWAYNKDIEYPDFSVEKAVKEFKDAGYTRNETTGYFEDSNGKILAVSISYLDNDLNKRIVSELISQWEEQGVILKGVPLNYEQIIKETISTRNFDLLLYEVETTVDPDQYNLWHSLKVDYPNLNLAGYKYNRVDILLERARKTNDQKKRAEDYKQFTKYLMADSPVIYLYQPTYHYFLSSKVINVNIDGLIYPEDRFIGVENWDLK